MKENDESEETLSTKELFQNVAKGWREETYCETM